MTINLHLPEMECNRPDCGHRWTPRSTNVRQCPRCQGKSISLAEKAQEIADETAQAPGE